MLQKIIRTTNIDNETVNRANLIMANQFFLLPSFEIVDFHKGIDWNYQHYKQSSSYQLYLQALSPVSYLINAFEVTKEKKYLKKAWEIIKDWTQYEKSNPENIMVWYDHPTAYRVQTLTYFLAFAKGKILFNQPFFGSLFIVM